MTNHSKLYEAIYFLRILNFSAAKIIIEENDLWGHICEIYNNICKSYKNNDNGPVYFLYGSKLGLPNYLPPTEQIKEMLYYWFTLREWKQKIPVLYMLCDRFPSIYRFYRRFHPPNLEQVSSVKIVS